MPAVTRAVADALGAGHAIAARALAEAATARRRGGMELRRVGDALALGRRWRRRLHAPVRARPQPLLRRARAADVLLQRDAGGGRAACCAARARARRRSRWPTTRARAKPRRPASGAPRRWLPAGARRRTERSWRAPVPSRGCSRATARGCGWRVSRSSPVLGALRHDPPVGAGAGMSGAAAVAAPAGALRGGRRSSSWLGRCACGAPAEGAQPFRRSCCSRAPAAGSASGRAARRLDARLAAAGRPLGLRPSELMAARARTAGVALLVALPLGGGLAPGRLRAARAVCALPAAAFLAPDAWLRRRAQARAQRYDGFVIFFLELQRIA